MTTTSAASNSGTSKQASVGYNLGEIQKIKSLVEELLSSYFPRISQAPDVVYVIMAILGFESGWQLLHRRGLQLSSMHYLYSPTLIKSGTAVSQYLNSTVIQNILRRPDISPTTVNNINQGCVAHGLSAMMGYYFVRGTPGYNFRMAPYSNVVDALGMVVSPGESITNLFQANDDLAKKRSIAAGILHLEGDYLRALNNGKSSSSALIKAIGSYLGGAKIADKNGMTPEQRVIDVTSGKKGINYALQVAGITQNGTSFAANSQTQPSISGSSNNDNRIASTSSTPSAGGPGCPQT